MLSQFLSRIDLRTRPKLSKAMDELAGYIQVYSKGLGQWRVEESWGCQRNSTILPVRGPAHGSLLTVSGEIINVCSVSKQVLPHLLCLKFPV